MTIQTIQCGCIQARELLRSAIEKYHADVIRYRFLRNNPNEIKCEIDKSMKENNE